MSTRISEIPALREKKRLFEARLCCEHDTDFRDYIQTRIDLLDAEIICAIENQILETPHIRTVNRKRKYIDYIETEKKYGIIYSLCQVGKSKSTIEFIQTCIDRNVSVILSVDNKTSQMDQMKSRILHQIDGLKISQTDTRNPTMVIEASKRSDLNKIIRSTNMNYVIILLDNSSQISKVSECLVQKFTNSPPQKIVIIHDEGDNTRKDFETDIADDSMAKSHKAWIDLVTVLGSTGIEVKRLFVTATPGM